jgi:hypothetical protein
MHIKRAELGESMSAGKAICVLAVSWLTTSLTACSFVDNFTPRQYSLNIHAQDALNQETLLNIIRASRLQPLNFMGISLLTGNQNAALTIGLPTITFGPGQSPVAREFIFTGNVIDTGMTAGFNMNPLISTDFQRAMLTPVSQGIVADLIVSYPREAVFYMAIAQIKRTMGNMVSIFRNDPGDDRDFVDKTGVTVPCKDIFAERLADGRPYHWLATITSELYSPENDRYCAFSKFAAVLRIALSYGLTATRVPGPATSRAQSGAAPTGPSGKNPAEAGAAGPSGSQGRLCFEEGLADLQYRATVLQMGNRCENLNPPTNFAFPFPGAKLEFEINLRSPNSVFGYIGSLVRNDKTHDIHYYHTESRELKSEPFINILHGRYAGCIVNITYLEEDYCIPSEGSLNTGIVLQVLQALRNLSIAPTDLNAPYSVRVVQ